MEPSSRCNRASVSTSLGRASTFLVHHTSGPAKNVPHAHLLRPSVSPSPSWGPSLSMAAAAGPSPRVSENVSQLPLDLLEPAATRWASAAGRASRAAPRVRSTLGPQSDVVDTGVFVCPDTIVAALYTTTGGRESLVVTAECAGWLRVREQRTGVIRHQQQLRDGNETSCLAWAAPSTMLLDDVSATQALQRVVVVGQLSGLISFYALVGESLVELAATCVLHEAPILFCLPLRLTSAPLAPSSSSAEVAEGIQNCFLTVDADGVIALWSLSVARRARGSTVALSVQLLHCSYASSHVSGQRRIAAEKAGDGGRGGEKIDDERQGPAAPPVVVSAASLFGAAASCAVFSTHRFSDHPAAVYSTRGADDGSSAEDSGDGSSSDSYADDGKNALVYLIDFGLHDEAGEGGEEEEDELLGADGITLAMSTFLSNTVVSASTDAAAVGTAAAQKLSVAPELRYGWEVLCAYNLPDGLRTRPENKALSIVSLCLVGGEGGGGGDQGSDNNDTTSVSQPAQLWAGLTDGRLFIWQVHTGQFVRCLRSSSTAPIHSLTCVPAHGFARGRKKAYRTGGSGMGVGGGGDPLVWASQADGSVVAWSAVTYAVVEVLPVSYPPPPPSSSSQDGGEAGDAVVTVRDAVDLLRATRHQPTLLSPHTAAASGLLPSPWRQKMSGFTLFVQPMEVVCMQRAWSVATDGTVRTWLLPAGNTSYVDGDDEGREEQDIDAQHRGTSAVEVLDAYTVECFLQDKADTYAREQQAQRLEWAAQQAQLSALQERNEVLATALQQAIGRLERVGADGLVRSTSPAGTPPSVPAPQSRESLKTPDVQDALRNEGNEDADDKNSDEVTHGGNEVNQRDVAEVAEHLDRSQSQQSAASTLSSPSTDSASHGQLVPPTATDGAVQTLTQQHGHLCSNDDSSHNGDTQMHVRVLQQLLEELHSKLEESWGRNDALREELLVYQLRTLEREEDMARRVREAVMREFAVAAAESQTKDQRGSDMEKAELSMSTAAAAQAAAGEPTHTSPLSFRPPSSAARGEPGLITGNSSEAEAETAWETAAANIPDSHRDRASRLTSPSRTVGAPAVETVMNVTDGPRVVGSSHAIQAPSVPVDPSDSFLSNEKSEEGWMHSRSYGIPTADGAAVATSSAHRSPNTATTAAADRFLNAASAALQDRSGSNVWEGRKSAAPTGDTSRVDRQRSQLSPLRHIRAPLPPVDEMTDGYNENDSNHVDVGEYAEENVDVNVDDENEQQAPPALVAAWSTSEATNLSPITISAITAPAAPFDEMSSGFDDSRVDLRPRRAVQSASSSLFSYPYRRNGSSSITGTNITSTTNTTMLSLNRSVRGNQNRQPYFEPATAAAPHSVRVYAANSNIDSSSTAGERGVDAASAAAYGRPLSLPASTARQFELGSPGPLPAARVTPVRHDLLPTTSSSSPRAFRSPIIYHY